MHILNLNTFSHYFTATLTENKLEYIVLACYAVKTFINNFKGKFIK